MRKLAVFAMGFSAAIFLYQYFLDGFWGLIAAVAAVVAAVVSCFLVRSRPVRIVRLAALGLAIGFLWSFAYRQIFILPAEELSGSSGMIEAEVVEYPQNTEYGLKTEVRIRVENRMDPAAMLYMYFDEVTEVVPGDIIRLEARLLLASEKTENDYFASKGIPLFAYGETAPEIVGKAEHSGLKHFPKHLARAIKMKIGELFPDFAVPFMTAILTGDRTLLNEESYLFSVLMTTGAAHVVAVSGMHVVFLVALLRSVLGKNKVSTLICLVLLLLFAAMTGFSPSVVRACIMQAILLLGAAYQREYDDMTSLSAALLLLLLVNPVSIKNGGLQLSFAATLGIILFGNPLYRRLTGPLEKGKPLHRLYRHKISRKLVTFAAAAISSSFGALVFTIPLSAVMFGYVSVIAPLTNLLILWAVSLAFSAGVIVVLIGFFTAKLGMLLAWIPAALVWYIGRVVALLAKIPYASVYTGSLYIRAWLIFMYAEFFLLRRYRGEKGRFRLFLLSNVVVLACCILFTVKQAGLGQLNAAVLDVGQGQCIVLTSEGNTAVVDCGGDSSGNAGDLAAEYLAGIGETSVDALILTHYHDDHANGAMELMQRVKVAKLIAPVPAEDDAFGNTIVAYALGCGAEVELIGKNSAIWQFGAAECRIIPPLGGKNENEQGLTVLCSSGKFDMLITGDMSDDSEYRLIEYTRLPKLELLMAGHHGSKNSTSRKLLEATEPETVIISVGHNAYGHPATETLERIQSIGAEVYRTDQNGTIVVKLGDEEKHNG